MTAVGLMFEGQLGLTWERWGRLLAAAEDFGYQCVFRSDHFTTNPQPPDDNALEMWVSMTYAAMQTKRIEFGSMVSPVTFRHPSLLAATASAVDDLSGGRLVLGMGTGWNEREHRQFGIPFYDTKTRFDMLHEALEVTTRLFRSDAPVSYEGKRFSLDGALLLPRPKRKGGPPILIGGRGTKRTIPLVAEFASEWNGNAISAEPYRETNAVLNEMLDRRGRARGEVKRSLVAQVNFARDEADWRRIKAERGIDTEPNMINGTAAMVIDQMGAFVDAGVERFMLQWLDMDDLDRIEAMARDVLPHFHGTS
jgi:F420-dependent oxidoreductase-like protein